MNILVEYKDMASLISNRTYKLSRFHTTIVTQIYPVEGIPNMTIRSWKNREKPYNIGFTPWRISQLRGFLL